MHFCLGIRCRIAIFFSSFSRFVSRDRGHCTYWMSGWMEPNTSVGAMAERKICPSWESKISFRVVQALVYQRYRLSYLTHFRFLKIINEVFYCVGRLISPLRECLLS
jgi:hypothetical protein